MKQWLNVTHTKKMGRWLYENGADKKIVGHSKLKLWTFFWDQSECEWPLYIFHYQLSWTSFLTLEFNSQCCEWDANYVDMPLG